NTHTGYALAALAAAKYPPDELTAALVEYSLVRQRDDGEWPALGKRPPSEGSRFTTAALVIEAFKPYGAGGDKKLQERSAQAAERGTDWLLANEPADTEDAVFRLRALAALGGPDRSAKEQARDHLLKLQREDGGWGQLPKLASDAYATGSALVALRRAGL